MPSTKASLTCLALGLLLSCEVQSVSPKKEPPPAPAASPQPISLAMAPTPPEPPKPAPLPANLSPYLGKETAKITLVAFTDYQCPFCNKAEGTIKELQALYGDDLRVVWKDLPLVSHKAAKPAAIAVRAVARQGNEKFFFMHNLLFSKQSGLPLDAYLYESYAASVPGIDIEQWKKDIADPATLALVETDLALASSLGVNATPTFFINGELLSGAQPIAKFQEAFNRQRIRAEGALAAGTSPEALYKELVSIGLLTKPKGVKAISGLLFQVPVEAIAPTPPPAPTTLVTPSSAPPKPAPSEAVLNPF